MTDEAARAWEAAPVSRRAALVALTGATAFAGFFSCGHPDENGKPSAPTTRANPRAGLAFEPADGAKDVIPSSATKIVATGGTLVQAHLISDDGKVVEGKLGQDGTSFETSAPLEFSRKYFFTGQSKAPDGTPEPFLSSFATLVPKQVAEVNVNIGDGQPVGVAAPIILRFSAPIKNKAAIEHRLKVSCEPATEGSWAWLPDAVGEQAHWRSKEYFEPGTKVHLEVPLFAEDFGDGVYCGTETLTSDFTIARHQLVKCFVPSHRMQVYRGDAVIMDFPCSYGEGNETRNTTRTGIHVVTEKYADFYMSNPPYYTNAHERYAVRISNNGEFIHANPNTIGDQGSTNVSNGCVNLSTENAQQYFGTALYGDPVEVTGTSVQLSPSDGEIYDWTYDWETWRGMSALG
ncbi:MAG: Ig-like domain-containing protein [Segniliparus sp.]|uniref:L,D-transpeptidase n=1 Tax=Segniliparus sp. TaxID=2804064 RepID=UPI003F39424A